MWVLVVTCRRCGRPTRPEARSCPNHSWRVCCTCHHGHPRGVAALCQPWVNPLIILGTAAGPLVGMKLIEETYPDAVPASALFSALGAGLLIGYAAMATATYLVRLLYVRVKAGTWEP